MPEDHDERAGFDERDEFDDFNAFDAEGQGEPGAGRRAWPMSGFPPDGYPAPRCMEPAGRAQP